MDLNRPKQIIQNLKSTSFHITLINYMNYLVVILFCLSKGGFQTKINKKIDDTIKIPAQTNIVAYQGAPPVYTIRSGRKNPKIWPIFPRLDHIPTSIPCSLLLNEKQNRVKVEGNDANPKNPNNPIAIIIIKQDKPIGTSANPSGLANDIIGIIEKAIAAIIQVQKQV